MADTLIPGQLFTPASIVTLTGATGAVYVICGALQRAFDFNPRWLALAISVVIALAGAHTTQPHQLVSYLVGLVNGCLIFCTATGVNDVFTQDPPAAPRHKGLDLPKDVSARPSKRKFTTRWS